MVDFPSMDMTKRAIKGALGLESDAELARFFHVNRQAVGKWDEDAPIPEGRQWELRARRPDLFAPAPTDTGEAA